MRILSINEQNNDHNINRVCTNMSEGCSSQKNIPKLTGTITEIFSNFNINNIDDNFDPTYDHLYACSRTFYSYLNFKTFNLENCESEVRFLEWLLLHLDLLEQQSLQIVSKEETIIRALQRDNQMLREGIKRLGGFAPTPTFKFHSYTKNMTQNAGHIEDDKSLIYSCTSQNARMNDYLKNFDILSYNDAIINGGVQASCDIDSEVATNIILSDNTDAKSICTLRDSHHSMLRRDKNDGINTFHSLKMSIRRKRLCSGSSAFSNNTSIEEPQLLRKRKQRVINEEKILTSDEQYITQASEIGALGITSDVEHNEIMCTNNLEVPRWRVRVYTSCYSMEGTENLDDDVYNKRHMRLENDERRRKRWDVQRIREQRVVEKLKLRQQRLSHGRANHKNTPVNSFWPNIEDVQFIEVCDELPVSAFGTPVPRLPPSDFSLPWLNNIIEQPMLELQEPDPPTPQLQIPVKKLRPGRKPKKRRKGRRR